MRCDNRIALPHLTYRVEISHSPWSWLLLPSLPAPQTCHPVIFFLFPRLESLLQEHRFETIDNILKKAPGLLCEVGSVWDILYIGHNWKSNEVKRKSKKKLSRTYIPKAFPEFHRTLMDADPPKKKKTGKFMINFNAVDTFTNPGSEVAWHGPPAPPFTLRTVSPDYNCFCPMTLPKFYVMNGTDKYRGPAFLSSVMSQDIEPTRRR